MLLLFQIDKSFPEFTFNQNASDSEYLSLGGVCDSCALLGPLPERFPQRESWVER